MHSHAHVSIATMKCYILAYFLRHDVNPCMERLDVAREGRITCLLRKSMLTVVNSIYTKVDGKIQRIPYTSKNGSETKWVVSIQAKKY